MKRITVIFALTAVFLVSGPWIRCHKVSAAEVKYPPGPHDTVHAITKDGAESTEKDRKLTLKDLMATAIRHNHDLAAARARIMQSESILKEARAAFMPNLSFFAEYTQGDSPSAFLFKSIDQRSLAPGTDFNRPGWFENYEAGIRTTLNLFSGGKDLFRKETAQTARLLRLTEKAEIENSLLSSVAEAYYNILAAAKYREIAKESIATVERELANTKVRYEAGGVLKSDVLSLEVRVSQAREELIRAENAHRISVAALKNLMGVGQTMEISLDETCSLTPAIPRRYEDGISYARERRPELARIKKEVELAAQAVASARADFLPRLDLEARYYYDSPGADFNKENWTAGLLMSWDLFSGGRRLARYENAKNALATAKALEGKVRDAVEYEVKSAYLRLADASERLETAKNALVHAEESLRLVSIQYRGGSAGITRYLEAELDRNRARLREITARYDVEKALAAAARAVGFWAAYFGGIEDNGQSENP
jgi:outer membrane protein TolC